MSIETVDLCVWFFTICRPPCNNALDFVKYLQNILSRLNTLSQLCFIGDMIIIILAPTKSCACGYLNVLTNFAIVYVIEARTREEIYGVKFDASCTDRVKIRA